MINVITTFRKLATRSQRLDSKVSWFACVCSSLANVIIMGCLYTYGILFPKLLDEFQAGKARTALVASLAMALSSGLCPVSAKLCNRFGCRVVIVCSGLTCALGLLGSSFAPNLYVLYFTYGFVFAFGSSMAYTAGFLIVPLYFDKHRSVATAMVSLGPGAGVLLMSPVTQTLLEHLDWRKTLMVLAAINVVPCILGCSITRRKKPEQQESVQREPSHEGCCRYLRSLDLSLFKDPLFMIVSISLSVALLGHTIPNIHLAKYAAEVGIPGDRSSWMYFTMGAASLVSRLLTGKLCDTGWIPHLRIFQCAVVILAAADLLLPFATTFTSLMVYSMVYGICEGLFNTPMHCLVLKSYCMGFGWYVSFQVISLFTSPVLAGFLSDVSGSYHPAFYTAGAILLLSACIPQLTRCFEKPERIQETLLFEEELVIVEKETVC